MAKKCGRDLEAVVEGAEHKPLRRQAACGAARRGGNVAPRVVGLVAVGQISEFLGEQHLPVARHDEFVGDDVIDERRAHGARIAEIIDLHGRRTKRQDFRPRPMGMAFQIDQDVDVVGPDARRGVAVRQRIDVGEAVESRNQPRAHAAARIGAIGVAVDLEAVAVVALDQFGDQISGRVVVKIRRQIADAQAAGPRRGVMLEDLLLGHGEMLDPFARAKQLIGGSSRPSPSA